jgi:hypothetical protein
MITGDASETPAYDAGQRRLAVHLNRAHPIWYIMWGGPNWLIISAWRICVVVPDRGQLEMARREWAGTAQAVRVVPASPYEREAVAQAAAPHEPIAPNAS